MEHQRATADYKAILTVGMDRRELIYYVLDAYIRRGSLDEALQGAVRPP